MINQPILGNGRFEADWVGNHRRTATDTAGYRDTTPSTPTGVLDAVVTALVAPLVSRIRRRAVRRMELPTGHVLEVGVGRGGGLAHYGAGRDVTGTDEDPARLAAARRVVASRALDHVSGLYKCPPSRLSFADSAFDAVTAFFVLRLGRKPRDVVRELVRVTRPGGRIVVVDRFSSRQATGTETKAAGTGRRSGIGPSLRNRLGRWLASAGFGSSTPKRLLTANAQLELISERALGPFGVMKVLEFTRRA